MKVLNFKISALSFLWLLLTLGSSCDDRWEEHYDESSSKKADLTLFEYIASQAELSHFTEILKTAGYDTLLSASQTYTVWAPGNASLEGVDRQDVERARMLAENHITRGSVSTSMIDARLVRLLNGKMMQIVRQEDGSFSYGGAAFSKSNVRTRNGLVHELSSFVDYRPNLWEYLVYGGELDSMSSYMFGLTRLVFSPTQSVRIGTNEDGNAVYDSTFIERNTYMETRGALNNEDSIYTQLFLDNQAWRMGEEALSPYFTVPDVFGGAQRGVELRRAALTRDLVYKGRVEDPALKDSLISTGGTVFYNHGYLFAGSTPQELSNGWGYVLNEFPFVDTLSWFKEIRVEAELASGRSSQNNTIFNRSGLGSGLEVSNNRYIYLEPSGTSNFARSNVTFSIPNTLSAKYKVYVVFVPASVEDPNNLLPTKVSFQLIYGNTTTGRTQRLRVTPENNETDPEALTKMLVTEIDFPFASSIDEDDPLTNVTLQDTNEVTLAEETAGTYSRAMRIDCVILEPVVE